MATKCSPRLLTLHEFSELFFFHTAPIHSSSAQELGHCKSNPNQWRMFSLPSLPVAPSPGRQHIKQEPDPSFHHHFCCFCWSCWGVLTLLTGWRLCKVIFHLPGMALQHFLVTVTLPYIIGLPRITQQ